MADNIDVTPGAGATFATDDVAGVHYQRMKLFTSEADSAEPVGDDDKGTSRALWMVPRPDVAQAQVNSAGLTIATTAYTAGDVLGSGWTFTSMAKETGGTGRLIGAALVDVADLVSQVTLHVFSGAATFGTDNAAPSISDADVLKWLGSIPLASIDLGGSRVLSADSIALPYVCDATSLFVYATTGVAHSFFVAVTDLKLRLFAARD